MRRARLRINAEINKTICNMEMFDNQGRHVLKLLTHKDMGDCIITCKYKEYNEFCGRVDGVPTYTQMKYIQSVQIKMFDSKEGIKVYEIHNFDTSCQINSITVAYNNHTPVPLTLESLELKGLEELLRYLHLKTSDFTIDFMDDTLKNITTNRRITNTPTCVTQITKSIIDEQKQTLTK